MQSERLDVAASTLSRFCRLLSHRREFQEELVFQRSSDQIGPDLVRVRAWREVRDPMRFGLAHSCASRGWPESFLTVSEFQCSQLGSKGLLKAVWWSMKRRRRSVSDRLNDATKRLALPPQSGRGKIVLHGVLGRGTNCSSGRQVARNGGLLGQKRRHQRSCRSLVFPPTGRPPP